MRCAHLPTPSLRSMFGAFKVNAANYIRAFELLRAGEPLTSEIRADPTMEFFVKNWDSDSRQAQEARRVVHPETTRLAFFPDLQHFYKRVPPGMNAQMSMAMDSETDTRVSEAISAWLNESRK